MNRRVTFPHKVRMLKNLHAVDVREASTRCRCGHDRCAAPGVLKTVHALPASDPQPLPARSALEGSSEPHPRVGVRALWPRVGRRGFFLYLPSRGARLQLEGGL